MALDPPCRKSRQPSFVDGIETRKTSNPEFRAAIVKVARALSALYSKS